MPPVQAIVLVYVIALVAVALRADSASGGARSRFRAVSYALSLSVLCTSWTYFGAVGTAMRQGWDYLPNFLGPVIALTVLAPVWQRVAVMAKRENAGSVADFLASRYGKRRPLGALIACVAIVGTLPYITLQMLSLSKAAALLTGAPGQSAYTTPLILVILGLLAIVFGARRPTLTQHNHGLSQIVTMEAVVKISALMSVAGVAVWLLWKAPAGLPGKEHMALAQGAGFDASFITSTFLCTITMFTLPRVFHLGFVTLSNLDDIRTARWLFPAYMTLWAAIIIPIALAATYVPQGDPDLAVLSLPLEHGGRLIATLAFLGGFSAGAAMVMVETIALSAMISNELILPFLARREHWREQRRDVGRIIVNVRRLAILAVLSLAYAYDMQLADLTDLSHLGFASLAASAQLAPALIGGLFWRRGHAHGAFWGIVSGMAVWLSAVAVPQLGLGHLMLPMVKSWDRAEVFNLVTVGSLVLNSAVYVVLSLTASPTLLDRIQADAFVGSHRTPRGRGDHALYGTVGDLRALLERFLGAVDARRGLIDFGRDYGRLLQDDEAVSPPLARAAERMLAGAIGVSSARNVIALALATQDGDAEGTRHILDEAANAVQFGREILHATLNSLEQGVRVVDQELRVVAWNQRYLELFGYDSSQIYIGKPVEDLIRANAMRDGLASQGQEERVKEQLAAIREGRSLLVERDWANGRILKIVGRPLSTGDYVTSFSDVTDIRLAARTSAMVNEELEQRVALRTGQLMQANAELEAAKEIAEKVTLAQGRFVAAASHDLLQPMHAARLYLAAAVESTSREKMQELISHADLSVEAADRLLKALLHLSRIEVGNILPDIIPVDLQAVLTALELEFRPLARQRGLELHFAPTTAWGLSNADLLRSVLQNLLGNAVRYTPQGRVFVGVRRHGEGLRIEVRDQGPGVAEEQKELIFREFTQAATTAGEGTGLGLAIAERICAALGHSLTLRSKLARGSVFSVVLPVSHTIRRASPHIDHGPSLRGLRVLCVEDQVDVLQAQIALLEQWGVNACAAASASQAFDAAGPFDAVLTDYHLGAGESGLDLLVRLGGRIPFRVLITANGSDEVYEEAARREVTVLRKPMSPAALRSVLMRASAMACEQDRGVLSAS